jgi:hypothetical protein
MKYIVYVPEVYLTAYQVEAESSKDAFLKVLNDEPGLIELGKNYSHTLPPDPCPEQVMWEVTDEKGEDMTMFIDDEGTSES